jgi:hypothetical protein
MGMATTNETVTSTMDLLGRMDGEMIALLIVVGIGSFVAVILGSLGLVTSMVNSIQRHRAELSFKREMVERGMSAEDIARVIEAASPRNAWERQCQKKRAPKPALNPLGPLGEI